MVANAKAKSNSGGDKRYLPRWEVNNKVVYRLGNQREAHECTSKDISCTGACLQSEIHLPKNSKVDLTIHLSPKSSINVQGHIVWNKDAEGKFLAGVVFENIPAASQEMILKHAFEIKKEDLVRHWFSGWTKKT